MKTTFRRGPSFGFGLWLIILTLVAVCLPVGKAYANEMSVYVSTSPATLSGPGSVEVTLRITTPRSIRNLRVQYNNALMQQLNSLPPDTVVNLTFSQYFNQFELGQPMYYVLTWEDAAGTTYEQLAPFTVPGQSGSGGGTSPGVPVISLTATVTADKTIVKPGEEVTISYVLTNTGNTPLLGITLIDAALGEMGTVAVLSPSDTQTVTVKKTLTQTVELDTTVIYSTPNSASTSTERVTGLTITMADPKLSAVLRLDRSEVAPGDNVGLTCEVRNTGSVPFARINISLSTGVKLESLQALKPDETSVITHTFVAEKTEMLHMAFTATDANGETYTFVSNDVPLKVMAEGELAISLRVSAKADITRLTAPGEVTLEILVSNQGSKAVNDLSITEDQIGLIGEMSVLEPGDKFFIKSVMVDKTTSYIFVVTTRDENGVVVTAQSEPLQIVVGADDVDLLPTASGDIDLTQGMISSNPAELFVRILGIIVVIIVLSILVLVVLILQERAIVKPRGQRGNESARTGDRSPAGDQEPKQGTRPPQRQSQSGARRPESGRQPPQRKPPPRDGE